MRFLNLICLVICVFCTFPAHGAVNVTVAGSTYSVPSEEGEEGWGDDLTTWIQAISANSIYLSGGTFALTADLDLGDTYGILAPYYKPETGTPASAGLLRLAQDDTIAWRNEADDGNVVLSKDDSDNLELDGVDIQTASNTQTLTNKSIDSDNNTITNIVNADVKAAAGIVYSKLSLTDSILNADVNSAAAIAYSKLNLSGSILNADVNASAAIAQSKMAALTASRAMATDASGFASATSVTDTELGYVSGVTSAIQTQIDGKATKESSSTDQAIVRFDGTGGALDDSLVTISDAGLLTMTVNSIKMQNQQGIEFWEQNGNGSNYLKIRAAAAMTDTLTFTLPDADGSNGQAILTDGSGNLSFGSPGSYVGVASKTTTYTATTSDDLILADTSGGAWTLTLPTAVGNDGKRFWIKYTDNNIQYALTVDGNGTETIEGALTTTLNTEGEVLHIASDGANWRIVYRYISPNGTSWTPTGAWSTNTTWSGFWWREGHFFRAKVLAETSGAPNSASFTINLPTGVAIDTDYLVTADLTNSFGSLKTRDGGGDTYLGEVSYTSSSAVIGYCHNTASTYGFMNIMNQSTPITFGSGDWIEADFRIPVVGWND